MSAATSPETLQRIGKQTEEIRELLALAAKRPFPFDRLEKQLGDLADRVERLATGVSPINETARVVEMLSRGPRPNRTRDAEDFARRDRAPPRPADGASGRGARRAEKAARGVDAAPASIDAPDPRTENAIDRSAPSLDLEDLSRRIDGLRASVEGQADVRPQVARVEAALGEIRSRTTARRPRRPTWPS